MVFFLFYYSVGCIPNSPPLEVEFNSQIYTLKEIMGMHVLNMHVFCTHTYIAENYGAIRK